MEKDKIKQWLDANVWDGEDRSGAENDYCTFSPDVLQELVEECFDDLQPQWVSVKTELPTEWVSVLVGYSGDSMTGNAYRHDGKWRVSASNDFIPDKDITHWMNRPLPPSEGE